MAVDVGLKRIGIATGETGSDIVTPQSPIAASGRLAHDARQIAERARAEEARKLIVGVPYGSEDDRQRLICERFIAELQELGLEVAAQDESLTSVEAEQGLRSIGLTAAGRRKLRDGEAAARILERYLSEAESE